jgi:hypothetical protein
MKKLLAIGLAACLPAGLAAEDPADASDIFGTVNVLVIEDSVPAMDLACAPVAADFSAGQADCAAVHRAVLTARIQKASALRERGRWL